MRKKWDLKRRGNVKNPSQMWVWIVLILAIWIALLLRLNFVFTAFKIPFNYLSDSSQYFSWAKHIISGKDFMDVYHQGPLFPFFLALVFFISGPSIKYALLVQAIMGSLNCLLVFCLSLKIFENRWMGVASAFMMAIYAPAIFYNGMLLMATLVTFIDLIFLLILLRALENNKKWIWGMAGLVLGVSALARATILAFIPFLILFLIGKTWHQYRHEKENITIRKMAFFKDKCLYPLGILLLCTFLIILPVSFRNYFKGKNFVLIAANAGITFYEGNNPWATGQYMDPPGLDLAEDFNGGKIARYYEKRDLRPSEISKFWFRESWRFISGHPFLYLKLLAKKFAYFWNRYEIPNAENIYFAKQYSKILRLPLLSFLFVGTLGLLGLFISLVKKNTNAFIVSLFLFSHMIVTVLFFITARYRLPIAPILIIFMVYSFSVIRKEFARKRLSQALLWIGIGIIFFLFVAFPWKGLNPRQDYASSYGNIGVLFHLTGNPQKAIRYFQMAIDYDPTYVKSYNNIGGVYYALGNKDEAMKYWRRGLELDPHSPQIHLNLGIMYHNEGQLEKAKDAYAIAAKHMPYSIKVHSCP